MSNTGWICPKCGAVNAPSVRRCECVPVSMPKPQSPYTGDGPPPSGRKWVHTPVNPFENMPRFDFMVRPWLVKYSCDELKPDLIRGWVTT